MTPYFFFLCLSFLVSYFPAGEKNDTLPFIKGVYGNPGTLLDAGYSFDSLEMNAVFVRSHSLNQKFLDAAREQGCGVYVEFPTLRNSILNGWVVDMDKILDEHTPDALLGVFYASWYPADHDSALYRTLGIDVADLAGITDVLSPMLFHMMKDRPVDWVGEYIEWHNDVFRPVAFAGSAISNC
ncbi:MAG: hypothetical protein ACLFQA_02710 [Bacteroidales bacterium]